MNLECRKTPCSIHSLVTLPARLSHYEGQRRRNEDKNHRVKLRERRRGQKERRLKIEGTN